MSQSIVEEKEEEFGVGPAKCYTDVDAWCMSSIGTHVDYPTGYADNHTLRIGQRVLIINAP
ncbi:MAG: hypothetical protein QXU32_04940 [Nitrososphaerales archaeon]